MLNHEGLDKVGPMITSDFGEGKGTTIWPVTSRPRAELEATIVCIHLPAIFFGLLPPFFDIFSVVLVHYQVHALHLEPKSILLLRPSPSCARPSWVWLPR